ncbi:MAG: translation factor [Zetaproteobacteria bacterium]|nr:MAG: translation factor [Zetaproteobacteria bacterium]
MRQGDMIAHHTATLPGIAAIPTRKAIARMQRFKQRAGPFLLLAADAATALRLARFFPPQLRRLARSCWPGPITLVFPARPGLPPACYQRGHIAVRVDAEACCRLLARKAGGLLLSTSLNRRGRPPLKLSRQQTFRLHRHLDGRLLAGQSSGKASRIIRVHRDRIRILRT